MGDDNSQGFRMYLDGISEFDPGVHRFSHPGLNSTYGVELEFFSSANRYDLANRVNSCMWTQNDASWRTNFSFGGRPNVRILQADNDFNQWSSWFMEASQNYHAPAFKGDATCGNRGTAGVRIEDDASVTLNDELAGITLWSKQIGNNLQTTDIKTGNNYKPEFAGLSEGVPVRNPSALQITRNPGVNAWNVPGFFQQNELVTNILFNAYGEYQFTMNPATNTYEQGRVPVGSLLLDNIVNHMTSHAVVLATQNFGFHVHLSEFPRITDPTQRATMIIGFVKLFYAFEPMLFAMHPPYRAESTWCQNLHSVFAFDEIRNGNPSLLWNDLVFGIPISGINRKIRGNRYLSLNLTNCAPAPPGARPSIGTVEVRLGHCSFDSTFIQAYINVLQTLFQYNRFMIVSDAAAGRAIYASHNYILDAIRASNNKPAYLDLPPNTFNNVVNRPTNGYFVYSANDPVRSGRFIRFLLNFFVTNTDSYDAINALLPYINEYHTNTRTWLNKLDISPGIGRVQRRSVSNVFRPVLLGTEYAISRNPDGTFKTDLAHRCKTCSVTPANQCRVPFNNGMYPIVTDNPRVNDANNRDQTSLYRLSCPDDPTRPLRGKTQTELINAKIGGKRIGGGSPLPSINMELDIFPEVPLEPAGEDYSMKNYQEACKINTGAESITLRKKEGGSLEAGYSDWVGGFMPDKKLTLIVTTLLNKKILDEKTLNILLENRYMDTYVFTTNTELHNRKLIEELDKLNIQPDTIEKIRAVYLNTQVAGRKTRARKIQKKRKTFRNKKS